MKFTELPGIAQASQVVLPLRQQRPLRHHAPQLAERRCGGAAVVLRSGGVQAAEEGGDLGRFPWKNVGISQRNMELNRFMRNYDEIC
jgi:hypothetical protein